MKITEGLLGEHALFYRLFDAIEEVMGGATSSVEIQRAFDVVRAGILSHAKLEEDVLFESLGPAAPGAGLLSVMRAEHKEIDSLAMAITRAKTVEEARMVGDRLIGVLREHFGREEEVLFPLCENALEASRLEALGERYKKERGLA